MQERKKETEILKDSAPAKGEVPAKKAIPSTVVSTAGKTVRAELKDAGVSPQKGRLVADLVRGMNALRALDVLSLTRKKAAVLVRKVLVSAMASAQNNLGMEKNELVISRIFVDEGVKFPRYRIVSRGRGHRYIRRRSRIIVELSNRPIR